MGQDTPVCMAADHRSAPAGSGGLIPTQAMLRARIQHLACDDRRSAVQSFSGILGIHYYNFPDFAVLIAPLSLAVSLPCLWERLTESPPWEIRESCNIHILMWTEISKPVAAQMRLQAQGDTEGVQPFDRTFLHHRCCQSFTELRHLLTSPLKHTIPHLYIF